MVIQNKDKIHVQLLNAAKYEAQVNTTYPNMDSTSIVARNMDKSSYWKFERISNPFFRKLRTAVQNSAYHGKIRVQTTVE